MDPTRTFSKACEYLSSFAFFCVSQFRHAQHLSCRDVSVRGVFSPFGRVWLQDNRKAPRQISLGASLPGDAFLSVVDIFALVVRISSKQKFQCGGDDAPSNLAVTRIVAISEESFL